jgi:hypothetical protein
MSYQATKNFGLPSTSLYQIPAATKLSSVSSGSSNSSRESDDHDKSSIGIGKEINIQHLIKNTKGAFPSFSSSAIVSPQSSISAATLSTYRIPTQG